MRMSAAVLSRLFRATSYPNAARSRCPCLVASPDQHRRCVHLSPAVSAKSLIHKFSTKAKKKPWYDSPSFIKPKDKPHGLMSLMKAQEKENRGYTARIKILNSILYKALSGLLSTAEVCDEVFDLQIELSKVSVTVDFSICRAYWITSGNKETDVQIETVLQNYAPRFRHLLLTHQILGNVPTILFLKDQESARRQELEDLFATLDFGQSNDHTNDPTVKSDDVPSKLDSSSVAEVPVTTSLSVFGIDHVEFNKKIAEYKKRLKEKQEKVEAPEFSQQQQEQLVEIRKQRLLKKKMKKQRWAEHRPVDPQDYLLATDHDLYSDNQEEYDAELGEETHEQEDDGSKLI
ncbi:putative ribosome-binding factor A, mitochondrial [Anomaloglossus baeobatrachus]|uniref:putative ribosome-binding factor A, mitochondrial n=1 Tax=Anomaloglossus baeobatrachus TaxID=238106 RepID=UPI003F4FE736